MNLSLFQCTMAIAVMAGACAQRQSDANVPIGLAGEVSRPKRAKPYRESSPGLLLLSERLQTRCDWKEPKDDKVASYFNDGLLRVQAMEILDHVADCLNGPLNGSGLTVTARTDARGNGAYDRSLGVVRSRNVRDYLTDRGVSASRIGLVSSPQSSQAEAADSAAEFRNVELDLSQSSVAQPASALPK